MNESKYLQWLVDRKHFLSISKIEKELSIPAGTLAKFVNGHRGLDQQWHERVIAWVKSFIVL